MALIRQLAWMSRMIYFPGKHLFKLLQLVP
jgi:hypothetical protein